jgi:hypothetical protein
MSIEVKYLFANHDALRAHVELMSRTDTAITPPGTETPAVAPATETPAVAPATETPATEAARVDGDGMPFDPELHKPEPFSSKGLWKAKSGCAPAANAARAAFKAGGGDIKAPAETKTRAALPGNTLPGNPPETRAPVSIDELFGRVTEMYTDGLVSDSDLATIYQNTTGSSNAAEATAAYDSNESARAAAMEALDEFE